MPSAKPHPAPAAPETRRGNGAPHPRYSSRGGRAAGRGRTCSAIARRVTRSSLRAARATGITDAEVPTGLDWKGSNSGAQRSSPSQQSHKCARWIRGLHEELGIDATIALADPQSIRFAQRVKAGQSEINGVQFESLKWLQDLGRKVADLRVTTTINAINAYRATLPQP
jgi:hypothetical protein